MGVHTCHSTMPGGVTPICNDCGVSLCWDISNEQYAEAKGFWEDWICRDCNDGEPLSLKAWLARKAVESKPATITCVAA